MVVKVLIVLLLLPIAGKYDVFANPQKELAGSAKRLIAMNEKADDLNISQISENNISFFKRHKLIIKIPDELADKRHTLPQFRYLRPWTLEYLESLAEEYQKKFKKHLKISSALRTIEYQRWLTRRNRNASPAKGSRASLHTRGIAFDVSHKRMPPKEKMWLRKKLIESRKKYRGGGIGKVEAIEENLGSANFHVVVFPKSKLPDW